ncbi:manganese catalase family protein [Bradyrhizobium sp. HKCCYLS1011]|uniref:manganese catalase family protein n=1 Tax=Bradyrhizobium sp. HKCCYLS1011 TaxID=3420733 RepID=UPI003EB83822
MLSYLIARDTMHQQQWLAIIEDLGGANQRPIPNSFDRSKQATEFAYMFMGTRGMARRLKPGATAKVRRSMVTGSLPCVPGSSGGAGFRIGSESWAARQCGSARADESGTEEECADLIRGGAGDSGPRTRTHSRSGAMDLALAIWPPEHRNLASGPKFHWYQNVSGRFFGADSCRGGSQAVANAAHTSHGSGCQNRKK